MDVDVCNLEDIDRQNREAWRSGVKRTSQLQLTPGPRIENNVNLDQTALLGSGFIVSKVIWTAFE